MGIQDLTQRKRVSFPVSCTCSHPTRTAHHVSTSVNPLTVGFLQEEGPYHLTVSLHSWQSGVIIQNVGHIKQT